jgi:hypothetical protein
MMHPPQGCARLPQQAAREDKDERRGDPRSSGPRVRSITARVRGGSDAIVLDLSASGALIEGARPLRPGARVEVYLALDLRRAVLPARVVRSLVAAIDADQGVTYHAALSFERRFDWLCEEATLAVSHLHEDAPDGRDARAADTLRRDAGASWSSGASK